MVLLSLPGDDVKSSVPCCMLLLQDLSLIRPEICAFCAPQHILQQQAVPHSLTTVTMSASVSLHAESAVLAVNKLAAKLVFSGPFDA